VATTQMAAAMVVKQAEATTTVMEQEAQQERRRRRQAPVRRPYRLGHKAEPDIDVVVSEPQRTRGRRAKIRYSISKSSSIAGRMPVRLTREEPYQWHPSRRSRAPTTVDPCSLSTTSDREQNRPRASPRTQHTRADGTQYTLGDLHPHAVRICACG
jgi:hypothetical protein